MEYRIISKPVKRSWKDSELRGIQNFCGLRCADKKIPTRSALLSKNIATKNIARCVPAVQEIFLTTYHFSYRNWEILSKNFLRVGRCEACEVDDLSQWTASVVQVLYLVRTSRTLPPRGGGGVLPYMGYIGMCRCEGYGFQAVYSRTGYINQSVWL